MASHGEGGGGGNALSKTPETKKLFERIFFKEKYKFSEYHANF